VNHSTNLYGQKVIGVRQVETGKTKEGQNLTSKEEHIKGRVGFSSYFYYAKAGGTSVALSIFTAQGCSRALDVGAYFWLAYWSNETVKARLSESPFIASKTLHFLGIYAFLGISSVIFIAVRGALLAFHRCRACRVPHSESMASILHAPVHFFDITPMGRILNRFAYDIDKVALDLKKAIGCSFISCLLGLELNVALTLRHFSKIWISI